MITASKRLTEPHKGIHVVAGCIFEEEGRWFSVLLTVFNFLLPANLF